MCGCAVPLCAREHAGVRDQGVRIITRSSGPERPREEEKQRTAFSNGVSPIWGRVTIAVPRDAPSSAFWWRLRWERVEAGSGPRRCERVALPKRRSRFTGARRSTTSRRRRSSPRRTRPTRPSSSASARRTSRSASRSTPTCSTWDAYWHTTLDTSNPPFWKWFVGGRLNACYNCVDRHLATEPEQGGVHLGARAGGGAATRRSPTRSSHRQVNEFAALLRGSATSRPVTGSPSTCRWSPSCRSSMLACARLGRDPFGGVRRLQRRGVRRPDRRLAEPHSGDDGRLLPQRRADRPQGEGRRGGGGRAAAGARDRQGAGVAPAPGRVRLGRARWSPAATSSSTSCSPTTAAGSSSRCRCRPRRRCSSCIRAARPGSRRAASTAPAGISPTSPARRSTTRTSTRTTPTGARPTSAGSPGTPTSCTARSRSARPA